MHGLLLTSDEHPAFRLTVAGESDGWADQLKALPGVLKVDQLEGRLEYRIEFDETQLDTNGLLQGIIGLNIPIAAFAEDKRHLNEAFMDLTERGVR
jgi:ABC-2 type transport system ATP-binding protein